MRQIAETFKALSDEVPIEIMTLLFRHGELCVCDVEAILALPQAEATRHLRALCADGLLEERGEGCWHHYRVAGRPSHGAQVVLDAMHALVPDARAADIDARYERWMAEKEFAGLVMPGACCREARVAIA